MAFSAHPRARRWIAPRARGQPALRLHRQRHLDARWYREPAPAATVRETAEDRLAALAASVGPLRRVLAAIAARLVAVRAWERLGYARLSDYARERPGISARQLHDLAHVHRALDGLPALERALLANLLPWSKVRLVARVARAGDEAGWIERARAATTRRLEQMVRTQGDVALSAAVPADDDEPRIRVALRCTPAVRERWYGVRELAERVAGERLRAEDALEWVLAEAWSALAPEIADRSAGGSARARACDLHCIPCDGSPHAPRAVARALPGFVIALAAELESADAGELDRRLRRAVHLEQTLDAAIARLLRRVGYRLDACARDQLGMSASKARSLLRLERVGDLCPELRRAWREGRLSWVKAQCLAPLLKLDLPGDWREVWVAWAQRVTMRRLERDVERALLLRAGHDAAWQRCMFDPARAQDPIPPREQQSCAHDVDVDATEELVWRVPREVAALFSALLARVRFSELLDHAVATWQARGPKHPVIERDGFLCAVPGCSSRRNLHDHHIEFRSAGGSDALENRVTLCAFHHLRCVHTGLLRIAGRAPDALVFELPLERFVSGDYLA